MREGHNMLGQTCIITTEKIWAIFLGIAKGQLFPMVAAPSSENMFGSTLFVVAPYIKGGHRGKI